MSASAAMMRFDGRVVIVTGAGSNPGLGRSYCYYLADRGARVVVNDIARRPDGALAAEAVAADLRARGGLAMADGNSVASREGAEAIVGTALREWGRVDAVINNAGIAPYGLFEEISDETMAAVI